MQEKLGKARYRKWGHILAIFILVKHCIMTSLQMQSFTNMEVDGTIYTKKNILAIFFTFYIVF